MLPLAGTAAFAVTAWLCLCQLPVAASWSCSLTMKGDRGRPQNLSLAQTTLHCTPDAGELGTALPVGFNDKLSKPSLQGVQAYAIPAGLNDSLLYFQQANLSFQGAQVFDIHAGSFESIIAFNSCTHLNLTKFVTNGCQASNQILSVSNSSSLYVLNSSFSNASALGLSVKDSNAELDGNVYENLSNTQVSGGALYVDNSGGRWVSVKRSNFSNNFAGSEGGAVYMKGYTCYFEDNRFINNSNGAINGGAVLIILNNYQSANGTFNNCFFANNTAGYNGIVYAYPTAGSIYFVNSTFVGNVGYQGGAVSLWDVALAVIDSCRFERNVAIYNHGIPGDGAALYVDGYTLRSTSLYIKNSTFFANNGSSSPGSAAVSASQCKCIGINGSTFKNNLGIALLVKLTQGDCENTDSQHSPFFNLSSIAGNRDSYLNQYMDDTILGGSTSVDIRSTTFKGNVDSTFLQGVETEAVATALKGGAGLSIQSTQRIMLVDLHFDDNKAWQGGALLLDSCFAAVIWSSTFTNNLATQGGGAIASVNNLHLGGLFIGKTSATNNTALTTGGALYGADQASIIIGNGTMFDGNAASTDGGAVACMECVSLTLQDRVAMHINHANASGGALYVGSSSAIQSINTTYYGNRAAVGGAVYIAGLGATTVSQTNFTNSTFLSNAANLTSSGGGGAIFLDGGITLFNGSTFQQNSASGYGGALVYVYECFPGAKGASNMYMWADFEPPISNSCSAVRSTGRTNVFTNNSAGIAGGAVYATDMASLNFTCPNKLPWNNTKGCPSPIWSGNRVQPLGYGDEIAYAPHSIHLADPSIAVYTSDGSNVLEFLLWVTDLAGQFVTTGVSTNTTSASAFEATVAASAYPIASALAATVRVSPAVDLPIGATPQRLTGQTVGVADETGLILLSAFGMVAVPGDYHASFTLAGFPLVPPVSKTIRVQSCALGSVTNLDNTTCSLCPNSTFSLNSSSTVCDACPSGAQCNGSAAFIPPQQYYHSSPYSTIIVSCPNPGACGGNRTDLLNCKLPGGTCNMTTSLVADDPKAYMVKMCSPGYYGPLCSLCLLHNAPPGEPRYGRTGNLNCQKCRKSSVIVIADIASTSLVMIWLMYIIHVTLRENEEDAQNTPKPVRISEFLKAAQLWLQYISVLSGINFPTPPALQWVFSAAKSAFAAVSGGSLSIDCLFSTQHNTAVQRTLVHLAVPVLVLLVMVLIQVIWWACTIKQAPSTPPATSSWQAMTPSSWNSLGFWHHRRAELTNRLYVTLLKVAFFYYPSLLATILSLFACLPIDPATYGNELYPMYAQARSKHGFWVPDMSVKCFAGWHLKLSAGLGAPLALIGCVFIPLLPCLLLLHQCGHLDSPDVKRRLAFLYCSYRDNFWYWESVVLVQTLGLVAAQVFAIALDGFFQLTIALLILVAGGLALAHCHPFEQEGPQVVQVMALGTVIITALGCLMFLDKNHALSPGGVSTIAILLVILNIAFLVLVALAVVKQGRRYFWTFLRKAQAFSGAALRLVKAAFTFLRKAPFVRKGQQPCLQLTSPNLTVPVRPRRTGSLQPMLAEMMVPSQAHSSFSSWSMDSPNH